MRNRTAILATIVAVFSCTSVAVAQDPVGDAYGGEGAVQGEVQGSGSEGTGSEGTAGTPAGETAGTTAGTEALSASAGDGDSDGSGSLPFTGFDVLLLILGGAVLIGAGALIRRLTPATPKT